MTDRDPAGSSSVSRTLRSYLDEVFRRVPLRSRYKRELREEFETHLEDRAEELVELGYKPYAVDEEIIRRVGNPEEIADQYNRVESLRSWFRDPACVRAVFTVAGYFIAFVLATKLMALLVGLSGHGQIAMSDFDVWMGHLRVAAAALSGILAYRIYAASTQNPHRVTPFATLSVVLFCLAIQSHCGLHMIEPFPAAKWDVFFRLNVPYFVVDENPWRFATLCTVSDFDIYNVWSGFKSYNFLQTSMYPHGPFLSTAELALIFISTFYVIERIKIRNTELAF